MKDVSVWWILLLEQHSAGNCVLKLTHFGLNEVDSEIKQKCHSNRYKFYNCGRTFQGFLCSYGWENNKKCKGSVHYQLTDKWVINVLEEGTMSFSALLFAQTNIIGFKLLTHSLTHFTYLVNQSPLTGLLARCWETQK